MSNQTEPDTTVTGAMRLQILSTEHWSLLASRALAWNESFARAGMFLSTLSFGTVALALVAQASGFGNDFRLFALVILPVLLFLGIGTQLRLDNSNQHDVLCVIGMNRIRAKYVELAPDLDPLFVMGKADDFEGIVATMALVPGRSIAANLVAATPFQIGVLNSVLIAAIVGVLSSQLGLSTAASLVLAAIGFALGLAAFGFYARRVLRSAIARHQPIFPSVPGDVASSERPEAAS